MNFKHFISQKLIFPLSDLLTNQKVYKSFQFLKKTEKWNQNEIIDYQNNKLQTLIKHSYTNVPYYKQLFDQIGICPDEIKTVEDLQKIPILTKKEIKSQGINQFTAKNFSKKKLIISSSSGSTGEPLIYYRTIDAYSLNLACNLKGWYNMGYQLGDKYVKISQNPRSNKIKKLQDTLSSNMYLSSNPLNESNFNKILCKIEKYKPKVIRCYPDPLIFLANYKKNHPEFKYNPKYIATTGNVLHKEDRKLIESVFQCEIFDSYSCEGNSTFFECKTHSCYHAFGEYGYSEVVDENGNPIKEGVGRLISTDLTNLAHPFIRYDTQDFVEINTEKCKCGNNHFSIKKILGRDNEILEMENGKKYIVHNFTGFFQTISPNTNASIEQFQVIKKGGIVIFNIVVNKNYNSSVETYIKNYWENEFECPIEIKVVEKINISKNGKRRFILNE
jgi:phenylacetate-CoA ligase